MKRTSRAVPPAPRSFEEIKLERSSASNRSNSNGNNNNTNNNGSDDNAASLNADPTSPWLNTASSTTCNPRDGDSPQLSYSSPLLHEARASATSTIQRGPHGNERHRYDTDDDPTLSAPQSLCTYADVSPSSPLTTTAAGGGGQEGAAREISRTSNAHGIDLSKSPTTAALTAGARAAGAAQPFFFSLKLPPPSMTHLGTAAATRSVQQQATTSLDTNNINACDSPHGSAAAGGTTPGERREHMAGGYARTTSASSPHKLDDTTTGSTPRIPAATAAAGAGNQTAALGVGTNQQQQSSTLFPRDVGPLPGSRPGGHNRLSSGTHIRRRPRSVANRRTAGNVLNASLAVGLMDSTENANFLAGAGEYGSPSTTALDVSTNAGGRSAFAPVTRPRGTGVGGRGTGRTREAIPPGSRSSNAAGAATAGIVPHRRRADPSPAPSRPPRARKAAAVIRATATPNTPALGATPASITSPSSPIQLELARSHTDSNQQSEPAAVVAMASTSATSQLPPPQSQQPPVWSVLNSSGASSLLSNSLDTRYLVTNDKDTTSAGNNNNATAHLNSSGTSGPGSNARGCGGVAGVAKLPSGRLISGAAAHTHTPRARTSTTFLRGPEEHTPLRHDYSKLAEEYVQLCTAMGEVPNADWISGLQSSTPETEAASPPASRTGIATTAVATPQPLSGDAHAVEPLTCSDLVATSSDVRGFNSTWVCSSQDISHNVTVVTATTATPQQQQQQTSTPRGGARQRGGSSGATTATVTPRARTPVASRAKSPRGGAAATSSSSHTSAAARRSGSVGRITTVNRASILGGSQTHGSGTAHTPRTRGATSGRSGAAAASATAIGASTGAAVLPTPTAAAVVASTPRESTADLYAQHVARYCTEHLQPYIDNMKHVQQQREVLDETLRAFVSLASSVIPQSSNATAGAGAAAEVTRKSHTPLPVSAAQATSGFTNRSSSVSHSHRGPLGSGKGVPAAFSPAPSSLSTTPRKQSTPRASVSSSLPNTASAAAAAIMSRRSATAAAVKAASLTDGLQNVRGAVVALLSSLAEGAKLAHLPVSTLSSSSREEELANYTSQSLSKPGGPPHSYLTFAPIRLATPQSPTAGVSSSSTNNVACPAERSQTLTQLISPPPPSPITGIAGKNAPPLMFSGSNNHKNNVLSAMPYLPLSTAVSSSLFGEEAAPSPLNLTASSRRKSQSAVENGRTGKGGGGGGGGPGVSTTECPPPIRFLDFVDAQEKEIAVQLSGVCATVRTALGDPGPLPEEVHGTSVVTASAAGVTTAAPSVQLEQADMLDNPFFVPSRYLQNLATAIAAANANTAQAEAAEVTTPKQQQQPSQADAGTSRTGGTVKSAGTATKSSKAASKKSKSSKSSGGNGGGITGRSSTDSTPRYRTSVSVLAPLFTVRLSAEETTSVDNNNVDQRRRSVSSSSTENAATLASADASGNSYSETFVLHCIQPTSTGLTPRPSVDGDLVSNRQNLSFPQFTVTEFGASTGGLLNTTTSGKSASGTGKASKRTTSASGSKRGSGVGQRSKSSAASTRAGTTSTTTTAAAEPPRAALAAPWLNQQGSRGSGGGGSSASSPSGKKQRKKTNSAHLNSGLSSSSTTTGGPSMSSAASSTSVALAHPHHHTLGHHGQTALQVATQRQLATAWNLWTMLEQRFVSSRKAPDAARPCTPDTTDTVNGDVVTEHQEEMQLQQQQFSPRPSSASQKDVLSTSPRAGVSGNAAEAEAETVAINVDAPSAEAAATPDKVKSQSTPPTANVSTAAATPARAAAMVAPSVESVVRPMNSLEESAERKALAKWSDSAIGQLGSHLSSPDQRFEVTVVPSKATVGLAKPPKLASGGEAEEEEEGDDDDENSVSNSATARVAENMATLFNALRLQRRLDMEESAATTMPLQSDAVMTATTAPASNQSSETTAPNARSMTLPQHAVFLSDSALASDDLLAVSTMTSKAMSEEERKAAQRIVSWWTRMQERQASVARMHATHATANAQQRRKVLQARVRNFLLRCVARIRLQRRIRAREQQQQQQQKQQQQSAEEKEKQRMRTTADASDSAETRSSSNNSGTPRSAVAGGSKKTTKSPTSSVSLSVSSPVSATSTSREKFLRSREQRKANTAASPSSSSAATAASSTGKDAARILPLPLATSGISTYAMGEYESESSFTVSAMHRLLHAPPSLLYTTCTAALHYPTHPPMAYVDTTSRARSNGTEEERQQSAMPPGSGTRFGTSGSGVDHNSHRGSTSRGAGAGEGNADSSDALTTLWRSKGVCFVPFRELRTLLFGEYEVRVPPRSVPAAMDCCCSGGGGGAAAFAYSPDSTLNSLSVSYRGGGRHQSSATTLLVPVTLRCDSIVEANELRHDTPVAKPFHRPFEQWGMAYNFTSRIFCAAAIYAWQLIFSHTPFDDAKQRELPTRDDRQARLERVAERNDIILDCYGVRSEREWMREATKDLSFVGQIYVPSYPGDDPAQAKECRDNYDFVRNFLFQCFPNINHLADIPDFLVGAGVFFVLKEVFHVTRDSPPTRRLQKYVPRVLVKGNEDYLKAVTPLTSPLYAGADDVRSRSSSSDDDHHPHQHDAAVPITRLMAAPTALATPRTADYGKGNGGLSGLQRAALQRYEMLRQLHHLSYGMLDEEERAACAWSGVPRSSAATAKSATLTSKEKPKTSVPSGTDDRNTSAGGCANASDDAAAGADVTSSMQRYMANSGAGPMTPMRATPTMQALSSAFNTPAAMREGPRHGSASSTKAATTAPPTTKKSSSSGGGGATAAAATSPEHDVPPRESDIQLVHVPRRLLRSSAADAQFIREFEEEVSKSVRRLIDGVAGGSSDLSFDTAELPGALAAGADVHDALDIAYPDHFLVKLSEMLTFELFGLQVSLSSCEDLDSTSS